MPAAAPGAPAAAPAETAPPAPPAAEVAAPPAPSSGARDLLNAADAALLAGNLGRAQGILARIVWEHPGSPEAVEARRALRIIELRDHGAVPMGARAAPARPAAPAQQAQDSASPEASADPDSVVVRDEPYSTRTSERLRLTAWEKLDFGVTAFLYGMSLGLTFALGLDNPSASDVTTPIALGATAYTLGAVAYLKAANPDRGDLPLMLAVTSYVPTTTLLLSNFLIDNPDDKKVALATAGAGIASIPLGIALTHTLNLDPGDTQLVRDAGFWGLVVFTTGALGFASDEQMVLGDAVVRTGPSGRFVSGMGLLGLYGGLGLGIVAASASEVSLERVRVTTWGGYGGAVLAGMIGLSMNRGDSERGLYRGLTVGALTGLIVTFVASSGLDGIPPADNDKPRASAAPRWTPGLAPLVGVDGRQVPGLGVAGIL